MAIDTDALILAIALTYALMALTVVIIVYALERLFKAKPAPHVSSILARFGAMIIDITILRFFIDLLYIIIIPSYVPSTLFLFTYIYLNPLFIPIMIVGTYLSNFLFFYIPFLGGSVLSLNTLMYLIIIFLYFYIFEAFLSGRTLGRFVFRLKTVHKSKSRLLHFKEACINAAGKTFLILDLVLGFMVAICYSHNPELRQIRLSQRIVGAVTMKTSFDPQTMGDIYDPFSNYERDNEDRWLEEN